MSLSLYQELAWLPKPAVDFMARCRSLSVSGSGAGNEIRALASFALNENQLNRLAKTIASFSRDTQLLKPLVPFRLGILSNSTIDFIAPALVASAARYGIALECIKPDYDQVMQEALSAHSLINKSKPDAVLVAIDHRALPLQCKWGDKQDAANAVQEALGFFETLRAGLRANSPAVCILQTIAAPPEQTFGSLDRILPGSLRWVIDRVNAGIADTMFGTDNIVFDVAGLAETVGLSEWHSPTEWNMAKLPFSNNYLPLYADHVARIIAALRGKSRRVLVLDLDNTIWGGVIGDDGLEGIQCAQGDATGEAFRRVQALALQLRARGVVLAVSSKNNDDVARAPFREHPEMLLKEEHIAVFQANWNDKATNIKAISEELSLGLDSFVFLDDNPAERALVRRTLPEVAVPELPPDPALYTRTVAAAGYFESIAFSEEDVKRAGYYQENAKRVGLQKAAADIDAYLESLDMEITFQPFDEKGRARITQLINKSNQFNLTTKRYTEAEVTEIERSPDTFTLQVRLSDTFGDNGMISVIICRHQHSAAWEIDTWLMSCRVLGRRVEQMVLRELVERARKADVRKLIGVFRPTDRNKLVKDHYSNLGFSKVSETETGASIWELEIETADVQPVAMRVKVVGF